MLTDLLYDGAARSCETLSLTFIGVVVVVAAYASRSKVFDAEKKSGGRIKIFDESAKITRPLLVNLSAH